ncbi:unnamed protein product [Durusdinium trenchii]|uniref:Uncharacterized protein n=2 Tax=Durusdinium trenchii TaxID=1381693 RepID=A0ABP0NG84_9DINO
MPSARLLAKALMMRHRGLMRPKLERCMSAVCIGGCIGVSRSFITWTAKSHLSHLSHPHLRPLSWKSTKFGSPVFSLTRPRARSVSVSSIAQLTQQAVDVSSGFVAFAAKAYGILLLAVFLLQRKLIYLPSGQVADPRVYGGEVIQIAGDSGTTSAAMFFRPQGSKPTIVFFHGNADQLGWGPADLGSQFSQAGYGFYGIEYPGYGLARPGSPTEESIYTSAEAMLNHLEEKLSVDKASVVLVGQSIGCGAAVEMAKRGFGRKLVLLSPFTSLPRLSQRIYPIFAPALKLCPFLLLDKFDNLAKAKDVKIQTLVIHGDEDEIIPFDMGQELSDAIPGSMLIAAKGFGHNDLFNYPTLLKHIAMFASKGAS